MLYGIERPDDGRNLNSNVSEWYEAFDENGVYAVIGIEVSPPLGAIHIEVSRWSPSVAKSCMRDVDKLMDIIRNYGIKVVIARYEGEDQEKWTKFVKLLGFPEPSRPLISYREI